MDTKSTRRTPTGVKIDQDTGTAASVVANAVSEHEFMNWVIEYARWKHWMVFHDRDSRRNSRGLPDLIMARGQRLVFAELKTEAGRVRPEQREWLAQLLTIAEVSNGAMGVYIWRPSDRAVIERILA